MILQEIGNPNPYFVSDPFTETDEDELREIAFVNSLAKFGDSDSFDFWYGIISGFPLCCIDYYINEWSYTIREIVEEARTMVVEDHIDIYNNALQESVQRTLCPLCIVAKMENMLKVYPI